MQLLQYAFFMFGVTRAVTLQNAEDGFDALQQWYNQSIGKIAQNRRNHVNNASATNATSQASGSLQLDGGTVRIVRFLDSLPQHPTTDIPKASL